MVPGCVRVRVAICRAICIAILIAVRQSVGVAVVIGIGVAVAASSFLCSRLRFYFGRRVVRFVVALSVFALVFAGVEDFAFFRGAADIDRDRLAHLYDFAGMREVESIPCPALLRWSRRVARTRKLKPASLIVFSAALRSLPTMSGTRVSELRSDR